MNRYRFADDFTSDPEDARWPEVLRRAHARKIRPLCLCKAAEPPAMYIAATKTGHALKRMPNTGPFHDPRCEHYEAPAALSGLGQVAGSAIREDPEKDETALAFDFALTKGKARTPVDGAAVEHDSVRSDGTKLTLRATLHYLLHQAGLTRWSPRMGGKRNWYIVRRELIAAASNKVAKGLPLNNVLFIPEPWYRDHAEEIQARRVEKLARLSASGSRMLVIGQILKFSSDWQGCQMELHNLPDMPFRVSTDLQRRIDSRFEYQKAMAAKLQETTLLLIGTFSQPMPGIFDLETACLVNLNEGFLPFESTHEYQLLERMGQRRFTKGLRFNLPSSAPIATAILHDTGEPTAVYLIPPGAPDAALQAFEGLAKGAGIAEWTWNAKDAIIPPLPPQAGHAPTPAQASAPASAATTSASDDGAGGEAQFAAAAAPAHADAGASPAAPLTPEEALRLANLAAQEAAAESLEHEVDVVEEASVDVAGSSAPAS